ncbi:ABC transporter permease [Novosphingobium sp. 1949]|uniref:Transport permease protein n=1 Tax=Novosphingobium organovorum TaxID=2930092 RepID=A0ABT0B9N9_9SPHN|nr:ABC transporter permease [Novosphingobium organovorum]MCJ2181718.1 ABC transporter permease [Novosphingobium organovorum]
MIHFNARSAWSIYLHELDRARRTALQSIVAPLLSTMLYFVVFGAAVGSRMNSGLDGVDYGAFIVPGLLMLTLLSESTSNGAFGIYMPRFTGAIYELLSAPVGFGETLAGFVGAAATKSLVLAAIIMGTARFFVDYQVVHPFFVLGFILLVSSSFSLFGFILGIWAKSFEQVGMVPALFVMPLTFLGGTFYSVDVLPEPWRSIALVNPMVYLVNGLRWCFYGKADFPVIVSLAMALGFLTICVVIIARIFATGWRLRS